MSSSRAHTLDFELPEVETIRRDLEREIIGRKVKAAEAASMKCLRRYHTRKAFTSQLEGAKIVDVRRVGLYLVIELSTEQLLVLSLGSSGSPRRNANKNPRVAGTEVVISFTQYGQLRFVDTEGTGQLFVVSDDDLDAAVPELAGYGLDPVATPISWTEMGRMLLQRSDKLKALLTDDTFVVGVGDIYADEILFEAGLRYDRVCSTLSTQEIRRLHRSLVGTMHDAVKYRGTSVPDRPFVDPFGQPGGYATHLKVWGRHGDLSERSRTPIKRIRFRGVWTYYCDTQV
ncbi:MAG: hypothetical protein F4011_03520 [Acidimicrobiaceae bacterium]|nr:hypothetical protein [Acidimicrobiaceae bacterium]MYG99953.1 hypothetical protein [Acidimicrobiaceae bacterium]MYL03235.1 hypothetical protein [Acidimicrobiaceae bacterium]